MAEPDEVGCLIGAAVVGFASHHRSGEHPVQPTGDTAPHVDGEISAVGDARKRAGEGARVDPGQGPKHAGQLSNQCRPAHTVTSTVEASVGGEEGAKVVATPAQRGIHEIDADPRGQPHHDELHKVPEQHGERIGEDGPGRQSRTDDGVNGNALSPAQRHPAACSETPEE